MSWDSINKVKKSPAVLFLFPDEEIIRCYKPVSGKGNLDNFLVEKKYKIGFAFSNPE
jgi:hypothetical protein